MSKILEKKSTLIKVGGNALTDETVKNQIVFQITQAIKSGIRPVVVHGGGIVIKELLDIAGIDFEFVGGHRKTDAISMKYVEMALSGSVNKELVNLLNRSGVKAVGVSGVDAGMVTARRRVHTETVNGADEDFDLGFVGDVQSVNTGLITTLLNADYVPVISPVSMGEDGKPYNVNADMFAGHLAGALKTDHFIAMTNVDGLLKNMDSPESMIKTITSKDIRALFGSVVQGGMIPKVEACLIALEKGVKSAHIINGTKKDSLLHILTMNQDEGTTITK